MWSSRLFANVYFSVSDTKQFSANKTYTIVVFEQGTTSTPRTQPTRSSPSFSTSPEGSTRSQTFTSILPTDSHFVYFDSKNYTFNVADPTPGVRVGTFTLINYVPNASRINISIIPQEYEQYFNIAQTNRQDEVGLYLAQIPPFAGTVQEFKFNVLMEDVKRGTQSSADVMIMFSVGVSPETSTSLPTTSNRMTVSTVSVFKRGKKFRSYFGTGGRSETWKNLS